MQTWKLIPFGQGVIVIKDTKESSYFCALPHINRLCVMISFSKPKHGGGKR